MERIVVDPKVMAGKPVIRGTRIPVDAIIRRIADCMTIEEYPNLTREDVKTALEYTEREDRVRIRRL